MTGSSPTCRRRTSQTGCSRTTRRSVPGAVLQAWLISTRPRPARRTVGLPICELWGMSEIGVATTNRPGEERYGTVGVALPGYELRLLEDGELLARGPALMKGYRHDPERTAEAIDAEGWMHTGDVATIDADGYVRIVDRKKELIITSGGKNTSPVNIESKIKSATLRIWQA